ncbi:F420-dependent peptide dehydroalanine reductase LxmJ [Streptomyces roseifaciens]|uniref:F420-dependent peptide dehydroalanine reductase LxmJ n=1 Tax=Streptomyces roseifaciens TaxID=1488406 RepID=UPI0007182540|nr:F420-dependent peptide dehydroalanine reductase LxmJ [Streptomyces roseifaciens]
MSTSPDRNTPPAVLYPLQPDHPELVAPFAALVQRSGARRLWLCQSFKAEPHQVLAYLAGAGYGDVSVGTSVGVMPLRHPYEAAHQARSLALLTGRPVVAGFGIGTPDFVAALTGSPYKSPRTAVRDYLTSVRALLDGEAVDHDGPYHHLDARLLPLDHEPVEVGAGVLRPGMARTAGEVADVAITWMTPPAYVRDVLVPALQEGADAAGRPARPRVATAVHVAVARPGRDLRRTALAGAGEHLKGPHYADMLRRAGVPVGSVGPAGPADASATATALLDHSVVVTGTPQEIAERLAEYRGSGVDEIMLNPAGVMLTEGVHAAVEDMEEIIAACG